jgi:WD40 repeat protein
MSHKWAIEKSPLQAYVSALVFSPICSLIRVLFEREEPDWITIKPTMDDTWSACLLTLEGHDKGVVSVAFSHDSTRLVSTSWDYTIRIWDAISGECLQMFKEGFVPSAIFSHDSTRLALTTEGHNLMIWDASSGKRLHKLNSYNSFNGCVYPINDDGFDGYMDCTTSIGVAFSHDSARIASASYDSKVTIWDANNGECLQALKRHRDRVTSVAFSQDSTMLASASYDRTVILWNTSNGKCLQLLKGHHKSVNSVAFSYDSTRLASASSDRTIRIWDARSGECLQKLQSHLSSVRSVAFSSNSTQLASASWDATIKIWDAESGKCLKTLRGHSDVVCSVAFSHDSTRLASASADNTIRIWDTKSSEQLHTPTGHHSVVCAVAFSYDSSQLVSAFTDGMVRIWDSGSGKCTQTLEGHSERVDSVVFSHNSIWLASASYDNTVRIWDARNGKCVQKLKDHNSTLNSITAVAFSLDSTRLASTSDYHRVRIWDTSSGECLQTLESHGEYIRPKSSRDTDRIWDRNKDGHCLQDRSVAFSRDSTYLASASDNGIIRVWDTCSSKCIQILKRPENSANVYSLAFSYDSSRLAASDRMRVTIWDARGGECLQTLIISRFQINNIVDMSFDITGSYLHTSIGNIAVDVPSSSDSETHEMEIQNPRFLAASLSLNGEWITHKSKNIVWIPSEYRPYCSAISGNTIGIGTSTGKVWICNLHTAPME